MPTDPTLVAALRDATAAQLREDAALMGGMIACRVELLGLDGWAESWRRLAALALAVARMQEIAEAETAPRLPDWVIDSTGAEFAYGSRSIERSLHAALSALLEDAP